jgi:hypothetical protein
MPPGAFDVEVGGLAVTPGRHHRCPDDRPGQGSWLLGNSQPSMTVSGSRVAPAA